MQMAEREFWAFISAVKELHGPEQAQFSAVDWLDELESMDSKPGSTSRHWRASRSRPRRDLQIDWTADRMIGLSMKASSQYEGIADTIV